MSDLISRQAALNALEALEQKAPSAEYLSAIFDCEDTIKRLPSIEQERKTGKWIMPLQDDGMSDLIYYQVRCSKCGFDLDPQTWHMELHKYGADKYCPKCGAKMEVE